MKAKKAPGPDRIPPEAVAILLKEHPRESLEVYNKLLREGIFPEEWKMARLVLIRKPDKPIENLTAYRPLCLLDVLGKVFEQIILQRLRVEVERSGDLHECQFGFRPGRSTEDALARVKAAAVQAKQGNWRANKICVLITLDVRNAFNTASWRKINKELVARRISPYLLALIQDYLAGRSLLAESQSGVEKVKVTCGVPQGSVLGPYLWNVLYDGVLRIEKPEGVELVAFADDLAIVAMAKTRGQLIAAANTAMANVSQWMREHELELAPEKTEAVMLAGARRCGAVKFLIGNRELEPSPAVKYLGVTISQGGKYHMHVEAVTAKARRVCTALSRLMPNVRGPRASKRRLYGHVVQSVILYAASIWSDTLAAERQRKKVAKVQRQVAIRVTSAYRTVSEEAVLLLASMAPLDLIAQARATRDEDGQRLKKPEKDAKVREGWRLRWSRTTKAAWTRRLIPDIDEWLERTHGEVSYYLTQVLSGHGCFRSYLRWVRKAEDDECVHCPGAVDDVEHTMFQCSAWQEEREEMEQLTGSVTPETW